MKNFFEKLTDLFGSMINKEFSTEIGRVNILGCILVTVVIIVIVTNEKLTKELTLTGILIMFLALIITFIICMSFVFKIESNLSKETPNNNNNNSHSQKTEKEIDEEKIKTMR